uniref:Uncharacterized protein n=1 Tax=Oryza glumipatula TaxID=40148 RepID=A0A0D9Z4C5_9ORYZ
MSKAEDWGGGVGDEEVKVVGSCCHIVPRARSQLSIDHNILGTHPVGAWDGGWVCRGGMMGPERCMALAETDQARYDTLQYWMPSGGGVARQRPDLRGAAAAALAETSPKIAYQMVKRVSVTEYYSKTYNGGIRERVGELSCLVYVRPGLEPLMVSQPGHQIL